MARKRRTPPVEAVEAWFSRFWKPDQERTSPDIRPKGNRFELIGAPTKEDAAAPPPPPVEPVPEPVPAPEPAPSPRPPPRQLRFKDGVLYEIGEDGRWWLAGDDGRQEESVLSKWKRMRDREVNFGIDPEKEWRDGKSTEQDVLVLAQHLLLEGAVREIDEEQLSGYPSERKSRREAAIRQYMEHLPKVREILLRGKS